MTEPLPSPFGEHDVIRLAEETARALLRAQGEQRQLARRTVRQAAAAMTLPRWLSRPPNDISLRRLLDGLPELALSGTRLPARPGFGERYLDEVRRGELLAMGEEIRARVGLQKVAAATERGRPLASYRVDDHGHGAQRTFLEVAGRFFTEAVRDELLAHHPLGDVRPPPRQQRRRALTEAEEQTLHEWIDYRRPDPRLDHLVIDVGIRTGFRREGVLTQTRDSLSEPDCAATAFQKASKPHRVPLAARVIGQLLRLGADRGGTRPPDAVFRTADGHPLTSRHLDGLFAQAQRERIFGAHLPLSMHWLRYTSAARIQQATHDPVLTGYWLNHALGMFQVTGVYLREPTWADLCSAAEAAFGPLCP